MKFNCQKTKRKDLQYDFYGFFRLIIVLFLMTLAQCRNIEESISEFRNLHFYNVINTSFGNIYYDNSLEIQNFVFDEPISTKAIWGKILTVFYQDSRLLEGNFNLLSEFEQSIEKINPKNIVGSLNDFYKTTKGFNDQCEKYNKWKHCLGGLNCRAQICVRGLKKDKHYCEEHFECENNQSYCYENRCFDINKIENLENQKSDDEDEYIKKGLSELGKRLGMEEESKKKKEDSYSYTEALKKIKRVYNIHGIMIQNIQNYDFILLIQEIIGNNNSKFLRILIPRIENPKKFYAYLYMKLVQIHSIFPNASFINVINLVKILILHLKIQQMIILLHYFLIVKISLT